MANPYYTADGTPAAQSRGSAAAIRNDFASVQAGFDGVNTAIGGKGAVAGQTWTGPHDFTGGAIKVPAPAASSDAVPKAYADALAMAAALPAQAGNAGKVITTDGTTANWSGMPGVSLYLNSNFGGF